MAFRFLIGCGINEQGDCESDDAQYGSEQCPEDTGNEFEHDSECFCGGCQQPSGPVDSPVLILEARGTDISLLYNQS